ncbi:PAS domain S-box protein [Belliella pelovolcani]|uniref:histidine kinase n=2 Tax=Belliella pelovolcani TaxID=529505 RepID=A0A1N7N052_9BACT|nr:PAS domain S-box protein [Belliella pelovolcani]SIS91774.1 PAS domain S-box-containing protein [Belliella pelovolcani]
MERSSIILEAIGKSYFTLQSYPSLKKSIPLILQHLGEATGVDRVYVFKNHFNEADEFCMTYSFEWNAPGVSPQIDFEYLQELPWSIFPEIESVLRQNKVINELVKNTQNGDFYDAMVEQGILSYLFVPIFSGGDFWGYIGFDNCKEEKLFTTQQELALHALASTLGTTILSKKQKKNLVKSRKSYLNLVHGVKDVIFKVDIEGNWTFLNQAWESISGYTIEESIGKNAFSYLEPSFHEQMYVLFQELVNGALEEAKTEFQLVTKSGALVWIKAQARIILDQIGTPTSLSGTLVNINQEKSIQAALQEKEVDLQRLNELLQAVNDTQLSFYLEEDFQSPLDTLLIKILNITGSKFGFIGEVLYDPDGAPYLKSHTISNIAWSKETNKFYEQNFRVGIEFRNLDTLFGESLKSGELVISNAVSKDPRAGGTPNGHPPLYRYLGIPVYKGEEFLGLMGFANKDTDYTMEDVEFLQPLISGYANLIKAIRINRLKKESDLLRQKADENYKLVSQNTGDIIALHDVDLTFKYISPSIEKVLGYSPEELIGRTPEQAFGVPGDLVASDLDDQIKLVVPHQHKYNKSTVYLEILMKPLRDEHGVVHSLLATSRDVTEREKMLEELKESLMREKELNQLKSRFISMTSHEFRTPLATIMSSTELLGMILERVDDGMLKEKSKTHIGRINAQIKRLTSVISDLLILERNAQDKVVITHQEVGINQFVKSVVDNHLQDMGSKIELELSEEEIIINTDPTWLSHILNNLIDNAVKYSINASDYPKVSVSKLNGNVLIKVQDFGIGIPKADHKYIFGSFFRAKNVSNIKGTGLGLNIVKEFINKLGGEVSFVSQEEKGSIFTLSLPYEN